MNFTLVPVAAFPLQGAAVLVLAVLGLVPLALAAFVFWSLLRVPVNPRGAGLPLPRYALSLPAGKRVVLLLTYGTRGDVQPMVALAIALRDVGLESVICTVDSHRNLVERNGMHFESCGVERTEQPAMLFEAGVDSFDKAIVALAPIYGKLALGMWKVAQRCEPCLIVSQAVVRGIGACIAEKLAVPQWSLHFAPSNTPTREFPPPDYAPWHFGFMNKLCYAHRDLSIARAIVDCGLAKTHDLFREETLQLRKLGLRTIVNDLNLEPSLHAYSPELQAKPFDWPSWVFVVGSFALSEQEHRAPPNALADFFEQEPDVAVVYIGFGSMEGTTELLVNFVDAVLRDLGLRAIVGAPSAMWPPPSYELSKNLQHRLIRVDDVPHDWLFPKCACVVHHGGAGTTTTGLRAGVRMVVVPVLKWSDQPFWARVVTRNHAGVAAPDRKVSRADCARLVRDAMRLPEPEPLEETLNGASVAASLIEHAIDRMYSEGTARKRM